jgi:drug/metabolite transporter (DMT)-like permease
MLGIVYGVLAAASFGFNNASARRGVLTGTAIQGLAISMPLGMLLFLLAAVLVGELSQISRLARQDILFLTAAGIGHFVWGRYFNMRSLAAVGSNLAGPVQQTQLLISLTLAIVFLGETLTPLKIAGILLVVSAPMYVLRRQAKARALAKSAGAAAVPAEPPAEPGFKPRMVEGYTYALLAALGFGTSPVLIKAGLANTGLSLLGGFVSYAAACAVVALLLLVPSLFLQVRTMKPVSLKWFAYSGVGVSFSQLFRYLALGVAPVTVVQPLQSLSLIFRMIFGYFINRDHESFDRDVILGIFMSFAGVLCLSLSLGGG